MLRLADTVDSRLAMIVSTLVPLVDPQLVLLFGSRAVGEPRADSDYDVMLVFRDGEDVQDKRRTSWSAIRAVGITADVVACSTSDYLRRQHDPACLAWLVSREGRMLHSSGAIPQRSPAPSVRERSLEGEREWLRRSDSDYQVASDSVAATPPREPVPDAICFHAHACIEKLLKALVARSGTFPPRTHHLKELLILQAEDVRHDPEIVAECKLLQQLYPNSRYPELPMPTLDDARRAFAAAHLIRDRLLRRLA
jgi:HEPN domain-containing protein/predicted nucleotidyltransferase